MGVASYGDLMITETDPTCFVCRNSVSSQDVPRENVARTRHWRVAHAFNSTLPGWLVIVPLCHVDSFAELPPAAMSELGDLIGAASRALHAELGCHKTYIMQFSEAEGFQHLHVHVVPRMADLPEEHRGPRIFHYLSQPESAWPSTPETDALATRLAAAIARER
jgi:diadenosine tetraphosphate (Ap4A) HIT family hydrolase